MGNLFRCAGGGESLNCIAKPYNANETYNKNDVVLYNNILYICTAYSVTGEWDSSKWKQTTLNELSESNPNIFYGIEWLDDEYDSTAEYNTNDTCMHRGLLYLCLEDGVTGEWDKTKWKRTYLLDCTKLNSNLVKKISGDLATSYPNTTVDCTSLSNYKNLTSDNFLLDIKSIYCASVPAGSTFTITKTYNATTGILTITRGSGVAPTVDIYVINAL